MKLHKVNAIIVTQYFETFNSKNSQTQVCKKFPDTQYAKFNGSANRNRVSNVSESTRIHSNESFTFKTDFESKLKLFTQWLQIVPMQLI